MPVMGRCACLLTDGASEGAGRRCLCVTLYSFVHSFVGARWPVEPVRFAAPSRVARGRNPRTKGSRWLTAGEAVKVRPLVRGGGEGAAPPKGHLGQCGPKGRLGRCDDWDGAPMPPRAASAGSSPSLTAQLAPRKAAPG